MPSAAHFQCDIKEPVCVCVWVIRKEQSGLPRASGPAATCFLMCVFRRTHSVWRNECGYLLYLLYSYLSSSFLPADWSIFQLLETFPGKPVSSAVLFLNQGKKIFLKPFFFLKNSDFRRPSLFCAFVQTSRFRVLWWNIDITGESATY